MQLWCMLNENLCKYAYCIYFVQIYWVIQYFMQILLQLKQIQKQTILDFECIKLEQEAHRP